MTEITGKEPATIAVSVAADLLRTFEQDRPGAVPDPVTEVPVAPEVPVVPEVREVEVRAAARTTAVPKVREVRVRSGIR